MVHKCVCVCVYVKRVNIYLSVRTLTLPPCKPSALIEVLKPVLVKSEKLAKFVMDEYID